MTPVYILLGVLLVALVAKRIIELAAEPFPQDNYHPHPKCFMCNDESCVGCPLIKAKEKTNG